MFPMTEYANLKNAQQSPFVSSVIVLFSLCMLRIFFNVAALDHNPSTSAKGSYITKEFDSLSKGLAEKYLCDCLHYHPDLSEWSCQNMGVVWYDHWHDTEMFK